MQNKKRRYCTEIITFRQSFSSGDAEECMHPVNRFYAGWHGGGGIPPSSLLNRSRAHR